MPGSVERGLGVSFAVVFSGKERKKPRSNGMTCLRGNAAGFTQMAVRAVQNQSQ